MSQLSLIAYGDDPIKQNFSWRIQFMIFDQLKFITIIMIELKK